MASTVATPRTSLRRTPSSISQSLQFTPRRHDGSPGRIHLTGDAVLDDGDAAALLDAAEQVDSVGARIAGLALAVGQRAQRERQALAHLLRDSQDFGLLWGEFQGG